MAKPKFAKPEQQIYDRMKGRVEEAISPKDAKKVEKILKKVGMSDEEAADFFAVATKHGPKQWLKKNPKYKKYADELDLVLSAMGFEWSESEEEDGDPIEEGRPSYGTVSSITKKYIPKMMKEIIAKTGMSGDDADTYESIMGMVRESIEHELQDY